MRLTIILLTAACMNVCAAGISQTVTFTGKNLPLKKVFSAIETQTGFMVFYNQKLITNTRPVTVSARNMHLTEFLDFVLREQPVGYLIEGKTIILQRKPSGNTPVPSSPVEPSPPPASISGVIKGAAGEPLGAVSVSIKGTSIGTLSNEEGLFSLTGVTENAVLVISGIGYEPMEIGIRAVSNGYTAYGIDKKQAANLQVTNGVNLQLQIVLNIGLSDLDEVQVMAYGSTTKRLNTGSVVTLKAADIENSSVANPLQSMQGRTPGLRITQNSGQPGAEGISLNIRGPNSFASNNSPLILVNGVVGDINTLDPSFIESVTVLKDASAAIYGARAANGVILVTTKNGAGGRPTITLNSSYLNQAPINQPERVWNSYEYMTMRNTAVNNAGGGATLYDQSTIDLYRNPSEQYPSFNWEKFMIKPVNIFNNTLAISGRSGTTNYHAGVGIWNQDGIVHGFDYKKYTGMLSIETDLGKRFRFGVSINGVVDNTKQPYNGVADMILATLSQAPTYETFLPDGRTVWRAWAAEWPQKPPYAVSQNGGNWNSRLLFNGNAFTQVKILENLVWEVRGGMRSSESADKFQTPVIPIYNWITGDMEGYSDGIQTISLTEVHNLSKYYTAYSTLNYSKTFNDDFFLNVLVGASQENSVNTSLRGFRRGFASQALTVLNAAPGDGQTTGSTKIEYALQSFFGRLNFHYKSKYLFEANLRRDGSSRFPPAFKFAYFPSVQGAWRVSQESFIQDNLGWVDDLKLRVSYGKLGNDNVSGNYPYQSLLSTGANYPFADQGGVRLGNLANDRLRWEETTTRNIGLDFSFARSAVYGSFDYFHKTTEGILRQQQIPAYSGAGSPFVNQGVVDNTGFELILGHKKRLAAFNYGIEGNISFYNNKVTTFGAPAYSGNTFMKEGHEMNRYFIYQADGIYQTQDEIDKGPQTPWVQKPGDVRIKDVNGDGVVNADDRVDVDGSLPNFYYGVNVFLNWKGFDFAVLFQGEQGRRALVNGEHDGILPFSAGAPLAWWRNGWTPENLSNTVPRMDYYYGPNGASTRATSTFWLQDLSYMRVRNVTLGYTVPSSLTQKVAMQSVRIFINAQNLFTFTRYEFGDPENVGGRAYPMLRTLTAGIKVQF